MHDRIADRPRPDQLHVRHAIVLVDPFEAFGLMILGVENLDQTMCIDRFLGDPRDVAHGVLDAFAVAAEAAVGDFHQPRDDGRSDDAEHRETPVHVEQRDQQRDDGQTVADQGYGRGGRRRRDHLDVVRQFREQMPGLLPIQVCGRQPQIVREHIMPQSLDDLPAHPTGIVALHIVPDAAQREQHHDSEGNFPQYRRVLHQEGAVQEFPDEVRQRGVGTGEQDRAQNPDQKYAEVGRRVLQQPPVHRPGFAARIRARRSLDVQCGASSCTVAMFS